MLDSLSDIITSVVRFGNLGIITSSAFLIGILIIAISSLIDANNELAINIGFSFVLISMISIPSIIIYRAFLLLLVYLRTEKLSNKSLKGRM
jgi:hypothetical protein